MRQSNGWPDGAIVGCGIGICWRVFAPRWWELGRWVNWLFDHRPHGSLTFTMTNAGLPDRKFDIRVVLADYAPPNVPTTEATIVLSGTTPEVERRVGKRVRGWYGKGARRRM
jgi:hypothetical protein